MELPRSSRPYEQSMGLWLNEPLIATPRLIDEAVAQLADAGFGIIRVFLRNTNYSHRSPEFVAAVARAVDVAHRRSVLVALDCEPHSIPLGTDLVREYPDARGALLLSRQAEVVDGNWQIAVDTPGGIGGLSYRLDGVEASFLRVGGTTSKVDLKYEVSRETHLYRDQDIRREMIYREQVPTAFRRVHRLAGALPEVQTGKLLLYLRYSGPNLADFWAAGFQQYFEDLLECYKGIPLDGVGWDEPAADCDWGSYRYGAAFAAAFSQANGYELGDKLYLMDEAGMSADAVRTRLDYYRTLNEGVARAQAALFSKARSLFGQNILTGSHHTWHGEGGINDYRAGAVDYFRLNDSMDAGYTDCSWWDPAAVAYAYTLASSLGRLTPSGEAEVNTWHYKPTVANIRRNVRLMTLLNITWFNIWFGKDCDCVLQQGHYTWPETKASLNRHKAAQQFIGTRRPKVEVAVWHGWEGVCSANRADLAGAQKTFCLNTSELFIHRSIAMDFIDSRLLAESRIEDRCLVNSLGRYRVLVIPYALSIPKAAFDAIVSFAKAGGRVIFVASPVAFDVQGNPLSEAFADLLGIPPLKIEHYLAGLSSVCHLPNSRPQKLEVCRALSRDLPRLLVSCEGEPHGVVSADGNVVFLTDLDPLDRMVNQIQDYLSHAVQAYGDNLSWRLYGEVTDDLLVVVARDDRPLSGMIRWKGQMLELVGGFTGLFECREGRMHSAGDVVWKPV